VKHLQVLSYAVNGSGLGHLQRQLATLTWMKRLGGLCGVHSSLAMLTTSEADRLGFDAGVATFKVPSKTGVHEAGFDKPSYVALAKQWTWTAMSTLRPDLLVVDTFANGSFHELHAALDLAAQRVLVYRPAKDNVVQRPEFLLAAQQYDLVVVPLHDSDDDRERIAKQLRIAPSRVRMVGTVLRTERFDMLSREEARLHLGVPDGPVVLLSAGGGGDDDAERSLLGAVEAISSTLPDVHVVVAAGPLYRGRSLRNARCTWWTQADLPRLWRAFDVAVCAAGYNSVQEVAFAGVPSVLCPQEKVADDQFQRAAAMEQAGASVMSSWNDLQGIAQQVQWLLGDAHKRQQMRDAAMAQVPRNHARDAAAACLELFCPRGLLQAALQACTDDFVSELDHHESGYAWMHDVAAALNPLVDDDARPWAVAWSLWRAHASRGAELLQVARSLQKRGSARDRVEDRAEAVNHMLLHAPPGSLLSTLSQLSWDRPPDAMSIARAVVHKVGAL
jgi:UDP-N-acetylglucosamine:LPS N-acetylglucosamine transferase